MATYGEFLAEPYFLGALIIAFALASVSIWWSKTLIFKLFALVAAFAMTAICLAAIGNLLSRPKQVTFEELQAMLPEESAGHLVLYGEKRKLGGLFLLLRSPGQSKPRYYLMEATEKQADAFEVAKYNAQKKRTQLLLGGKQSKTERRGRQGGNGKLGDYKREASGNSGAEESPDTIFHPAPIAGGPEKAGSPQDGPVIHPFR